MSCQPGAPGSRRQYRRREDQDRHRKDRHFPAAITPPPIADRIRITGSRGPKPPCGDEPVSASARVDSGVPLRSEEPTELVLVAETALAPGNAAAGDKNEEQRMDARPIAREPVSMLMASNT